MMRFTFPLHTQLTLPSSNGGAELLCSEGVTGRAAIETFGIACLVSGWRGHTVCGVLRPLGCGQLLQVVSAYLESPVPAPWPASG